MQGLVGSLVLLVIVLVLFLVARAIVLWYWKIDKIEEHLAAIRAALEKRG